MMDRNNALQNQEAVKAGKDSFKLAQYYEKLGAQNMGRFEHNTAFGGRDQKARPYGMGDKNDNNSTLDRHHTDDIPGASPNAYGKARFITGKNYMDIQDIPGAKPHYKEVEERYARIGVQRGRGNQNLDVQDINKMNLKARNLYKRSIDPLDPVYQMPEDYQRSGPSAIGLDGTKPIQKHYDQTRDDPYDRSLRNMDIDGAQPKQRFPSALGDINMMLQKGDMPQPYSNRNIQNSGDIIGNTNDNPMLQNQNFSPRSKRVIRPQDLLSNHQSQPISPRSLKKYIMDKKQRNHSTLQSANELNYDDYNQMQDINERSQSHMIEKPSNFDHRRPTQQPATSMQPLGYGAPLPLHNDLTRSPDQPYAGTLSSRVNMQPLTQNVAIMQSQRSRYKPIDNFQYFAPTVMENAPATRLADHDFERSLSPMERSKTHMAGGPVGYVQGQQQMIPQQRNGAILPQNNSRLGGPDSSLKMRFQTNNIIQSPTNQQMQTLKAIQLNQQHPQQPTQYQ